VSDLRAKFCGRSGGYHRYLRRLTRILGVQVQRMSNAIGRIFQRERR
jgi:DNA-binding transcriptional MocR family regulator